MKSNNTSAQEKKNFLLEVLKFIRPGTRVLDVGAGQGTVAALFLKKGAEVTAVDQNVPRIKKNKKLVWVESTIEDYIRTLKKNEKFDLIFMRNVLQFFDKNFASTILLNTFFQHLSPKGIVAIRTFERNPEPPFEKPFISYYSSEDLERLFCGWEILFSKMYKHTGPDLKGRERLFFLTDFIARRQTENRARRTRGTVNKDQNGEQKIDSNGG